VAGPEVAEEAGRVEGTGAAALPLPAHAAVTPRRSPNPLTRHPRTIQLPCLTYTLDAERPPRLQHFSPLLVKTPERGRFELAGQGLVQSQNYCLLNRQAARLPRYGPALSLPKGQAAWLRARRPSKRPRAMASASSSTSLGSAAFSAGRVVAGFTAPARAAGRALPGASPAEGPAGWQPEGP